MYQIYSIQYITLLIFSLFQIERKPLADKLDYFLVVKVLISDFAKPPTKMKITSIGAHTNHDNNGLFTFLHPFVTLARS